MLTKDMIREWLDVAIPPLPPETIEPLVEHLEICIGLQFKAEMERLGILDEVVQATERYAARQKDV